MNVKTTFWIGDDEFEVTTHQVVVSPPREDEPARYYANLNPTTNKVLAPVCRAIEGCWKKRDFISSVLNKRGCGFQSVTSFQFFKLDEYCESPEIRIDLKPQQRGVVTHYLDESIEVSEGYFVRLAVFFCEFCIENQLGMHLQSEVDEIKRVYGITP